MNILCKWYEYKLTNEKTGSFAGLGGCEVAPLIEDQDTEVAEDCTQKYNLRDELCEDVQSIPEISVKKNEKFVNFKTFYRKFTQKLKVYKFKR